MKKTLVLWPVLSLLVLLVLWLPERELFAVYYLAAAVLGLLTSLLIWLYSTYKTKLGKVTSLFLVALANGIVFAAVSFAVRPCVIPEVVGACSAQEIGTNAVLGLLTPLLVAALVYPFFAAVRAVKWLIGVKRNEAWIKNRVVLWSIPALKRFDETNTKARKEEQLRAERVARRSEKHAEKAAKKAGEVISVEPVSDKVETSVESKAKAVKSTPPKGQPTPRRKDQELKKRMRKQANSSS